MLAVLVGCYATVLLCLIACAGVVALSATPDETRRKTAYDMLKLLLTAAGGGAGVLGVAIKLHEAGLW